MSYQTALQNFTPFTAEKFIILDQQGQEVLLVVVVSSFESPTSYQPLELAKEQSPIRLVDEYYGDPAVSSIRYASDIALEKPFVDVLLNAHAYAPKGKFVEQVVVEVQAGDIRKELLVQGDRRWILGPLGKTPSTPESFAKMPIVYERAFGGIDSGKMEVELRNPIGVGFRGVSSHNSEIQTQAPNIEYPQDRLTSRRGRPAPAGFGAVSRNSKPRIDFAGTYDDIWLSEHWPLLPMDFDPRYNQAAPVDQQSRTLQGGEKVELLNLTPEGRWAFKLPKLDIPAHLFYADRKVQMNLRMDTVLIEPDLLRVTMTSRLKVLLPRNKAMLREIVLGHMYPGWIRAKAVRKKYIDKVNMCGVDPKKRSFHV